MRINSPSVLRPCLSTFRTKAFAIATLFSAYYRKWWWAFGAWALLVGLSRVAVGVHYPSDVAGGAAVGALLALGVVGLWRLIERRFFPSGQGQERA